MAQTDELTGELVIVNPGLANDPAARQGQIGMITSADIGQDDVFVSFGKGEQARYSFDALQVLKKPNDLYRGLMGHSKEMETFDFKTLFQISLLQQSGNTKDIRTAMTMAMTSDTLKKYSLVSLDEHLGLSKELRQANGIGR
jgi:hypothetical protein